MFKVPAYDDVSETSRLVFDSLKKSTGKVANLYAIIGASGNALSAYITFVQAQAKGSFHSKDREAIYLIVSELNGCEYCLSAHTLSAVKFGWKEEETWLLRAGKFPETKWEVIYLVIKSILNNKGEVAEELLQKFFGLGYSEAALIDLLALINLMSFTNYAYRLTKVPIDFPLAKPL